MADNSGGGAGIGVIVGALVVVVALVGFFALSGGNMFGGGHDTNVNVHVPSISTPK